jgi:DTW domain-containing protein YfiP
MGTAELKSNLLEMMGNIQDEQLLQSLYDFLKSHEIGKTSQFWDKLTVSEKDQVLLSYEESENEADLIPYKEVFK